MIRSKSLAVVLLTLVILFGMQFFISEEAFAAELAFSNVKLEGDMLSWDSITNCKGGYHITMCRSDGRKVSEDITSKTEADLAKFLDLKAMATKGIYTVTLTASDKSGNTYKWEGNYNYDKVQLKCVDDPVIDPSKGYLIWSHDTSNAPGAKIQYKVVITVDNWRTFTIKTTDKKILPKDFAFLGTHDYEIKITASAEGYRSAVRWYDNLNDITITNGPVITGITVKDGIISWDEFSGADYYIVETCVKTDENSHMFLSLNTGKTRFYAPYYMKNKYSPQIVNFYIAAYRGEERISCGTMAEYCYDSNVEITYPLKIRGKSVTSASDLAELLPGEGCITYYPAENKLVFDDFELKTSFWSSEYPLIESSESLTVEGKATLTTGTYAIYSEKELIFAEGSDITVHSRNHGIYAKKTLTVNGDLNIDSEKAEPLYSYGNIVFGDSAGTVTLSNGEVNFPDSAIYSEHGTISLGKLEITVPSDGKLNDTSNKIIDPEGNIASTVTLSSPSKRAKGQILDFVERIYKYVLDREPEEEGAAFWSEELYAFRRTGAEVAQGFIFSPEFENRNTSDEEFVTILYKTFFGRDPEEEGMNFWLNQLKTGTMDRITVANGFIYSQEWADTCASYGIRSGGDIKPSGDIEPTALTYAFVERMYTTAMGRTYDEEGRQYWASELANFNITGEQVGASFFLSDEMTGYKLDDKEFLNRLYKTFMDRDADEDGAAYWLEVLASGTARTDVVFGFTRSQEFTDKCVEARILPY